MLAVALALATLQGPLLDHRPAAPVDPFSRDQVEVDGLVIPYRLLAPPTLEDGARYPLILFLHGAGERGDDNEKQLTHFPGGMASAERRAQFPCFVLAPQCPATARWTVDPWSAPESQPIADEPTLAMRGAIEALREVVRAQPIDLDRIYLTGLSMGGYGTYDLALRHPDWFAALAPVCGGGDEREAARLAGLPISIWHGDADQAVPVVRSQTMAAALRELGEAPLYDELQGVGHAAWVDAYGDRGCLPWLFDQRRDPLRRMRAAARMLAGALRSDERVAFFGDSITQAGAQPGGYVDLLRTELATLRPKVRVIPAGISGNKVTDLLMRAERDVQEKGATLVFIYIGINDVWHSLSGRGTPRDPFASGLETLARRFEDGFAHCSIATATVIGERTSGANELDSLLEDYVALTRGVAAATRVLPAKSRPRVLCDLHEAFRGHLSLFNTGDAAQGVLTTDGVHLNAAGNVLVATEAALALRRLALAR